MESKIHSDLALPQPNIFVPSDLSLKAQANVRRAGNIVYSAFRSQRNQISFLIFLAVNSGTNRTIGFLNLKLTFASLNVQGANEP